MFVLCRRCAAASPENSYDTYNRPFISKRVEAGQCPDCEGTGLIATQPICYCLSCRGSGLCPECHGEAHSETGLPGWAESEWLEHSEMVGLNCKNYQTFGELCDEFFGDNSNPAKGTG